MRQIFRQQKLKFLGSMGKLSKTLKLRTTIVGLIAITMKNREKKFIDYLQHLSLKSLAVFSSYIKKVYCCVG